MFNSILVSCLYIYKTFLDVIFIIQMAKVNIKCLLFKTSLNNLNLALMERVSLCFVYDCCTPGATLRQKHVSLGSTAASGMVVT